MARRSSLETLPPKILAQVNFLIGDGRYTIDDVVAHLQEIGEPRSRSAVGRHAAKINLAAARLKESRAVTEALVTELGDSAAQGKQGRLLVEMARSLVFDVMTALEPGDINAKDVANLGKGLAELGRALRLDQDFEEKVRTQVAKEEREKAADTATKVAQQNGLSADTVAAIKAEILGIRVEPS
ncbi:MAG: DUF3486 family protein [Magnetospiraceae bacterium]